MINVPLLKHSARALGKLLLIFGAVLTMYISLIVTMYQPEMNEMLAAFAQSMPEVMAMMGMGGASATLTAFLSNYLYGFLMLVFPMVFTILAANRLVASYMDSGAMAYLLASPNPRGRVVRTQGLALLLSQVLLMGYCTVLGIGCAEYFFPGALDTGGYVLLNLGVLCLHLAIGGFCFFVSCICNEIKHAVLLGAGVPTLMYLLHMLANMGGKLQALQYATLFTLFDRDAILLRAPEAFGRMAALAAIGAVLYAVGGALFCRRDLPL